ncbi:MAG: hypothetical protein JNM18_01770 [Planctomycetaceae bacterium]|nr:hypothetical protein [Planctomycetaceae bacterium]
MHLNPTHNSNPPTTGDSNAAPQNVLADFVRRRWPALIVCLALSAAGGWYAGRLLGQTSFTFASLWLYAPQTQTAPYYNPPDVGTIVSLIRSPGLLATVAEEFKLPSSKVLASNLRVEVPYGSQMISMQLEGDQPPQIVAILNRIGQRVEQTLGEARQRSLERALTQLSEQVAAQQATVATAVAALREFQQSEQIVDLDQEVLRVRTEIDALEVTSRTGMTRDGVRTDDTAQRRGMLRDLIQEERDAITARNQLTLKRNEYERAKALHDKRYISTAEFQRIETELQSLVEQEQGLVARYRAKLKEYDAYMATHIQSAQPGPGGSPQVTSAESSMDDVRRRYDELLAERRARQAHLLSVFPRGKELVAAVTKATAEKDRLEGQLATLRQAAGATDRMLSALQSPRPALDPTKSTSKKIMAGAGLAILLVSALPLVLLDLVLKRRPNQTRLADDLGLPLLTRRVLSRGWGQSGEQLDHDEVRRLALRIQQSTPADNRVVLLTSATSQPLSVSLVASLAERMAQRGEQVALVEIAQPGDVQAAWHALAASPNAIEAETSSVKHTPARSIYDSIVSGRHVGGGVAIAEPFATTHAPKTACGLSAYLGSSTSHPGDTLRRSTIAGVDLILSEASLPEEGLASRRMTALVTELRERYSLVILAGPAATDSVDVQMLAARADAIVVCATGGAAPVNAARSTLAELIDARAPLLGMVC